MRRSTLFGLVLLFTLGANAPAFAEPAAAPEATSETATATPETIGSEVRRGKFGITSVAAVDLLPALRQTDARGRRVIAVLQFDELQGFCGEREMVPQPGDQACHLSSWPQGLWIVWEQLSRGDSTG
jgi:hypothetical protein